MKGHAQWSFGFGALAATLVCAAIGAFAVYLGATDCGPLRLPAVTMGMKEAGR